MYICHCILLSYYYSRIIVYCCLLRCRTFIKRPDSTSIKWRAYTAPFDAYIWYFIGLLILLSSGMILMIKIVVKLVSYHEDFEHSPSTFSEIMFYVFGVFCSQGTLIGQNLCIVKIFTYYFCS